MYGFHKVSDVFHTGSPESPMWEFRHGNGSFRKGDVASLRDIKRRASRHTLIQRDSFSTATHKPGPSQPGTPAEAIDGQDGRMMSLEQSLYDVNARLSRMEDQHTLLSSRCQVLTESLTRCHHVRCPNPHSESVQGTVLTFAYSGPIQCRASYCLSCLTLEMRFIEMVSIPMHLYLMGMELLTYNIAANMQREVSRQLEFVRALETPHEALLSGRQQYLSNACLDNGGPLSPRQAPQDESRRPSVIRHHLHPHMSASPHRHNSIAGPNAPSNYHKAPAPRPAPHPLSAVSSPPNPSLARRHTSADIRQHGWPAPAHPGNSPFGPGSSTPQWPPSSPSRANNPGDQHVKETLARYELGGSRRQQDSSRNATPPFSLDPPPPESGWSLGAPKFPRPVDSTPATRRSSMVHSLLNPADTAERPDEDEGPMGEDRKRKRLL